MLILMFIATGKV